MTRKNRIDLKENERDFYIKIKEKFDRRKKLRMGLIFGTFMIFVYFTLGIIFSFSGLITPFYIFLLFAIIFFIFFILITYKISKIKIYLNEKIFYFLTLINENLKKYQSDLNYTYRDKALDFLDEIQDSIEETELNNLGFEKIKKINVSLINLAKSIPVYRNEIEEKPNDKKIKYYINYFDSLKKSILNDDTDHFSELIESRKKLKEEKIKILFSRIRSKLDAKEIVKWIISISVVTLFIIFLTYYLRIPFKSDLTSVLVAIGTTIGGIISLKKFIVDKLLDFFNI